LYAFAAKRTPILRDFYDVIAEEILRKLASGTVLDVGTGPGYLPVKVALGNTCLRVHGLDISRDMVKLGQKNVSENRVENVQLIVGDVERLGVADESVDLVVAALSFHHWANPAAAFEELFRIVKIGGEVWIYEFDAELTPQSKVWIKKNYNIFTRVVAPIIMKMARGHSITQKQAEKIVVENKGKFVQVRTEQLEPSLVKMVLIKSQA
jgi:ubiquinone/menaquinone biosynthesis C-methylase UbiE